jgi:hypothetical protein
LFVPPSLEASGATALGAALKLLSDCLATEVRKSSAEMKGDFKPLVLLLMDGPPTDTWEDAATALRATFDITIICIACGDEADLDVLKKISDITVEMRSLTPSQFQAFFEYISASLQPCTPSADLFRPSSGATARISAGGIGDVVDSLGDGILGRAPAIEMDQRGFPHSEPTVQTTQLGPAFCSGWSTPILGDSASKDVSLALPENTLTPSPATDLPPPSGKGLSRLFIEPEPSSDE